MKDFGEIITRPRFQTRRGRGGRAESGESSASATIRSEAAGAWRSVAQSPLGSTVALPASPPLHRSIPERYEVRESEGERFLHGDEAPRVRVIIDRKLCASEAEARAMGERVIFLDGAGDFAPTLDNKARVYNLDHHQGCIRPFTLATCEQALILVLNGLELDEGDWTVYANEPDLDTLLAIWVLLNFRRIPKLSARSRDVLLPLLRLEGAIDANGSELSEYCGLTLASLRQARERLDELYALEKSFRSSERVPGIDLRDYTVSMLWEIDQLVYTRKDFEQYSNIEEILGHVEIAQRKVAVACRDRAGIYEAERLLKDQWGDQLGIIALEKSSEGDRREYTLRRVSAILDFDLAPVYELLNLVDPAVDGRPAGKRWGGSDDIGGSPRPSGTRITPTELLRLLQVAYRPRTSSENLRPLFGSVAATLGLVLLGGILAFAAAVIPEIRVGTLSRLTNGGAGLLAFSLSALVLAAGIGRRVSRGRLWLHGWRRPAGRDWLYLAPVVLACALPATAWVPRNIPLDPISVVMAGGVIAVASLASEVWFRGLVHGWFLFSGRVERVGGPWFISRATAASAVLYALFCLGLSLAWRSNELVPFPDQPIELAITGASALIGGVALGMIRERSLSLWPGVGMQILGGMAGAALALSIL